MKRQGWSRVQGEGRQERERGTEEGKENLAYLSFAKLRVMVM